MKSLLALVAASMLGAPVSAQVIISCDLGMGWGYITEQDVFDLKLDGPVVLEGRSRTVERVDTAPLTTLTDEDERGFRHRTGTETISKQCGPFTVLLSSGWWNPNPNGEMGGDEFSVIEVRLAAKTVLGPVGLGTCTQRALQWGNCPAEWAISITLLWEERRPPVLAVKRAYSEFIVLR